MEVKIKEKNILLTREKIKEEFFSLISTKYREDDIGSFITSENINLLIKLYDINFLDNYLNNNLERNLKVSISNRMTRSAGKTIFKRYGAVLSCEIRVSIYLLSLIDERKSSVKICGIETSDVLEGLMLILEHELCHIIEFLLHGNSNCKAKRFKIMAWKLFRHTTSYHEILSYNKKINNCKSLNIRKGDKIKFIHRKIEYIGIVVNINKRYTVMVEDISGIYEDKYGVKYNKWYVPIDLILDKVK